jgi:S1-C subfamily serine protease
MAAVAPAFAAHWVELATKDDSGDKLMVDMDSLQKVDQFKMVDLMTVHVAPRLNSHNILLDRFVQRTAIDCANKSFVAVKTTGYLNDKSVGSGETADWQTKLKPFGKDALSNRVYDVVCTQGSKPRIRSGSGFVVDRRGYVLTNNHVVNGCKSIVMKASDSLPVPAIIDAVDPKNDLAVLKTTRDIPLGVPARFRNQSKPGKLGESIGVVGYPLTGILSAEPKATFGQINSVAGANNDYTLLQISAPVQPGNSGGPVLDTSGLVVGVVVSQASLAVTKLTGSIPQNVNFAIRGEVAQIFLAARGIKIETAGDGWRPMKTEDIAAEGEKSTVFILCSE